MRTPTSTAQSRPAPSVVLARTSFDRFSRLGRRATRQPNVNPPLCSNGGCSTPPRDPCVIDQVDARVNLLALHLKSLETNSPLARSLNHSQHGQDAGHRDQQRAGPSPPERHTQFQARFDQNPLRPARAALLGAHRWNLESCPWSRAADERVGPGGGLSEILCEGVI